MKRGHFPSCLFCSDNLSLCQVHTILILVALYCGLVSDGKSPFLYCSSLTKCSWLFLAVHIIFKIFWSGSASRFQKSFPPNLMSSTHGCRGSGLQDGKRSECGWWRRLHNIVNVVNTTGHGKMIEMGCIMSCVFHYNET